MVKKLVARVSDNFTLIDLKDENVMNAAIIVTSSLIRSKCFQLEENLFGHSGS